MLGPRQEQGAPLAPFRVTNPRFRQTPTRTTDFFLLLVFLRRVLNTTDPCSSEELFSSEWHLTLQILINGPMSSFSTRVGFLPHRA